MRATYAAISLGFLTLATAPALAQDQQVVKTLADSTKVGLDFRAELRVEDNGLKKVSGQKDPDQTSIIDVEKVRLKLTGKFNPHSEYKLRFGLAPPKTAADGAKTPLDYGWGRYWLTESFGLAIGKMKVVQGGWDSYESSFRDHYQGHYKNSFFFKEYEPMIAASLKVGGEIILQVFDDKVAPDAKYNKTKHPTFALGWLGDLGPVKPAVFFGTADNQKSMWFDVGLKVEHDALFASVDFRQAVLTSPDPADSKKELEDTKTALTAEAAYALKNIITPRVYVSTYDVKQPTKDRKTNTTYDGATGKLAPTFDDNGQTLGLSIDLTALGKGWTPYLAFVSSTGKFEKAPGSGEESKSATTIKLGTYGEF